tara:strand:+ start:1833 stop:3416 length:1584 start_codon:yes stop_codon:yes gene_type:complete
MANGRYRMDPYAAFAQTIKPQGSGGLGAAMAAFKSGPSAMDKKTQALKEAQFIQSKKASDQAMAINQERFNQQKRVIASGDILSNLENDEFMTLGNLPTGIGDVFDENAFMESHYGVLGKKQEFMEKYRQRVDDKNKELGLNITPDLGKAEAMYNQFTTREAEKKLVDLMRIKQAKGMTAKEFNLYLRGVGNTHAGSNAVNFYLQNVDPNFKDSWAKQTGYVHGYETGWEDWIPGYGPGGERSGGAPKSTTGEKIVGYGAPLLAVAGAAELAGAWSTHNTKQKALDDVNKILKNKNLYQNNDPKKSLKSGWQNQLTEKQKALLGKDYKNIKGKAGLNKWATSQKTKWQNIRPSEWARRFSETGVGQSVKEAGRVGSARFRGAGLGGIGRGVPGAKTAIGIAKGAPGAIIPFALPSAGQAVAGDEGELAGRAGASAIFASQSFKNFTGRPLGFFKFAKKVMGPRLARFGAKAAARQATAAAAGAVAGGVGAIPTSIGMGLLNAGLSVWEVKKLFDDYKEYQKTGKISP